jgi:hypothetical protein
VKIVAPLLKTLGLSGVGTNGGGFAIKNQKGNQSETISSSP